MTHTFNLLFLSYAYFNKVYRVHDMMHSLQVSDLIFNKKSKFVVTCDYFIDLASHLSGSNASLVSTLP